MTAVSNPPSLSSVVAVFGGPGNLAAYYRGGPYVPSNSKNTAIATSASSLKLSQFAGAMTSVTASVSPTSVSGSSSSNLQQGPATSNTTTASGTGGGGSYTYAWSYVSGDTTITCNGSTSATASFSATNIFDGSPKTGVWKCTVSDSTTSSSSSANVSITLSHISTV